MAFKVSSSLRLKGNYKAVEMSIVAHLLLHICQQGLSNIHILRRLGLSNIHILHRLGLSNIHILRRLQCVLVLA